MQRQNSGIGVLARNDSFAGDSTLDLVHVYLEVEGSKGDVVVVVVVAAAAVVCVVVTSAGREPC